jgi:anti-sigma factor RsiW
MATDPTTTARQGPDRCEQWRFEVGVYVLGALSPAERQAFEEHLSQRHPCRHDLASVAGLPGLLARLIARGVDDTERRRGKSAGLVGAESWRR